MCPLGSNNLQPDAVASDSDLPADVQGYWGPGIDPWGMNLHPPRKQRAGDTLSGFFNCFLYKHRMGKLAFRKYHGDQDPATTRRWVRRFMGLSEQATSLLGSILLRLRQELLSLVTSDDGPCRGIQRVLGALPETPATSSFGRANIWLALDGVALWL
jgi:hypothetical protein